MANKVTISNINNKVTITPQSNNSVSTSTTNTPVTVTQGTAKVITVNTPGPKGEKGDLAGFTIGTDVEIRNITASGNISASGGIQVGTGTFIGSEEEAKTDAALVIPINSKIYTLDNDGGNLRNLISKGNDRIIDIGQTTIFINEIRLVPGTNGFTSFYNGGADTEVARIDAGGNITASGNISADGFITASIISASGNIVAKRWNSPVDDTTNIQFLDNALLFQVNSEVNNALVLNSAGALFNSANDPDRDFKIGTGTTDDFLVVDAGDNTLTISGSITASGNISASGDVSATRFIASGSDNKSGFVFPNPEDLTDLFSNRISLTSAQNMQFRAGNVFQFTNGLVEILNGNALMLKNNGNSGKIHLDNAGTGIESRFRIRTGSVELMTISGSGNIGIGTTTPEDKLTIENGNLLITASTTSTRRIEISNAGTGNANAELRLTTLRSGHDTPMGSSRLFKSGAITFFQTDEDLAIRPNARLALNVAGTGDIRFVSSTLSTDNPQIETTYFIADTSTRRIGIGIGNTAPSAPLHINSSDNTLLLLQSSDGLAHVAFRDDITTDADTVRVGAAGNDLQFIAGGTERGRFDSNGNLGIGTNNPTKTLTVEGDISASGDIILLGTSDITTTNGTDDIRIIPDNFLELGTTRTDQIFIGRTETGADWPGSIKLRTGTGTSTDVTMAVTGSKVGIGTTTPSFALDVTGSLANNNDGGVVRFESAGGGDLIFNDGCQGSNETAIQFNNNGRISGEGGKLNFSSNTLDIAFNTGSGIKNIITPALTISGSGEIKLDYDNMPTSNPNEKGVIYRSSSNGIDNLLFISPG